ncbi:hypothetical protein D3C72_2003600 [compost metagenome]
MVVKLGAASLLRSEDEVETSNDSFNSSLTCQSALKPIWRVSTLRVSYCMIWSTKPPA